MLLLAVVRRWLICFLAVVHPSLSVVAAVLPCPRTIPSLVKASSPTLLSECTTLPAAAAPALSGNLAEAGGMPPSSKLF